MHQFRRMSRYIMQDDLLQPLLTVQESMLVAADLKLSRELSKEKKLTAVCFYLFIFIQQDTRNIRFINVTVLYANIISS